MSAETVIRRVARDVDRRGRRSSAVPRLLAGIFCGLLAGAAANANPVEPTVTHGSAQFARPDANTLDVTTSSNAIINWRSFSIGAGETTRFTQPSASSAVLNRVTGSDASSILGQLLSNGRVFLVNPHGIVFGEDAVVDTAGLVASTLGITDEDFLAGRYEFDAGPDAGDITNRGLIKSGTDGVFLLAPGIENSGVVRTAGGDLVLAAGSTITLTSLDLDGVQVEVQAPDDEALNLGGLIAERGAAGVFAGSIRNSGTVEANAVAVDENGVIRLVARNDITLEAGGTVAAEGPSGGEIRIESGSGTTSVSGDVSTRASEGAGGSVRLLGHRVGLDGATVDASGPAGGGEVLVGGDERGEGTVPTAESTWVSSDSTVSADALTDGDGGKVVVFAEGFANIQGRLSARGGPEGGDGGFVETSGLKSLAIAQTPDTTAPKGEGGEWLIDPNDIEIVPGGGADNIADGDPFTSTDDSARLGIDLVIAALSGGQTVTVQTTESGGNSRSGDITLAAPLDIERTTGTNTLVLDAHRHIIIDEAISDAAGGSALHLVLDAGAEVLVFADVTLLGGSLRTQGGGAVGIDKGAVVTLDGVTWHMDNAVLVIGSDGQGQGHGTGTVVARNGAVIDATDRAMVIGEILNDQGSTGTLTIESGADVTARWVVIGEGEGSNGTVTVTGSGSSLTTVGTDNEVFVGNRGTGTIHVLDGGLVDTRKFHLAWWGVGRAVIRGVAADGTRSRVIVSPANGRSSDVPREAGFARVTRNAGSIGHLEILEGGLLRVIDGNDTFGPGFQLGRNKGTVGTLLIDGEGSSLEVIQNGPAGEYGPYATLGRRGRGVATIRNGGRLLVRGERASVEVSRDAVNPDYADSDTGPIDQRSEVSILSGGGIAVDGERASVVIGNGGPAADGVVTVSGPGSTLVTRGTDNSVTVGDEGTGALNVLDGGLVETLALEVGRSAVGRLVIRGVAPDGTRSRAVVSPAGGKFSGVFESGGGFARAGRNAGSHGFIEILDGGLLRVLDGNGTHGPGFDLARNKGSAGTLSIDGAGSSLEVIQNAPAVHGNPDVSPGPFVQLARRGGGTTTIRNGGRLVVRGDSAFARVSRDSIYERFPDSDPGPIDQRSVVNIESGGRIEIEGEGAALVIGDSGPAADGEVAVTGPGTVLDVSGTGNRIVVGDDGGTGVLEAHDGGAVRYGELVVGENGTTNVTAPARVQEQADAVTDEVLQAQDLSTQEDDEPDEEEDDDTEEGAAAEESGETEEEELQPCPT